MTVKGENFQNSETCKGVVFAVPDAPLDFAEITINGRYPEEGWAVNHKVHEMVRVHRGASALAIRGVQEEKLLQGDVVHIPPETPFVWQGDMILHVSCSPPFDPEQYEIKDYDNEEGENDEI